MRMLILGLLALSILVIGGCSHDYRWSEYKIAPERIESRLPSGQHVKLIKGQTDEKTVVIARMGVHKFIASEADLRDGIIAQLGGELKKQAVVVDNASGKSLEIAVTSHDFEQGAWRIAATIGFTVKLGDAKTKSFEVRNSSPTTVYQTYDGAVALAVIKILNDPDVQQYLKQ